MKCRTPGCGSIYHFEKDCPKRQSTLETEELGEEEEEPAAEDTKLTSILETTPFSAPPPLGQRAFGAGSLPSSGVVRASPTFETQYLNEKSVMSAAMGTQPVARGGTLDTACRRGVMGREWLRRWEKERAAFIRQHREFIRKHPRLREWSEQKTIWRTSQSLFKFGDGRVVKAIGAVWLSVLLHDGPAWIEWDVVLGCLCALFSRPTMTKILFVLELPEDTVLQLAHKRGPVAYRVRCRESPEKHLELPLLPQKLTEETLAGWTPRHTPALTGGLVLETKPLGSETRVLDADDRMDGYEEALPLGEVSVRLGLDEGLPLGNEKRDFFDSLHPQQPTGPDGLVWAVPEVQAELQDAALRGTEVSRTSSPVLELDQYRVSEPKGLAMAQHLLALFAPPESRGPPLIPSSHTPEKTIFGLGEHIKDLRRSSRSQDVLGVAEALGNSFLDVMKLALSAGFKRWFPSVVESVHRSELSKTVGSLQEAKTTLRVWKSGGREADFFLNKEFGRFLFFDTETKQVVKGPRSNPPQLRFLLEDSQPNPALAASTIKKDTPLEEAILKLGLPDARAELRDEFLYWETFADEAGTVPRLINRAGENIRALPPLQRRVLTAASLDGGPAAGALRLYLRHQQIDLLGGCPPSGGWSEAFRPENQGTAQGLRRRKNALRTARLHVGLCLQQQGQGLGWWLGAPRGSRLWK